MSELGDALSKLASAPETYQCITNGGLRAEPQAAEFFFYFLEKIAILVLLNRILHVFRAT